jgi:hypothetical protein
MTQHLGSGQTDNEFDLDRPIEGDIARLCTAKFCRQNRLDERGAAMKLPRRTFLHLAARNTAHRPCCADRKRADSLKIKECERL